jgi:hypothetical protein
MILRGPVCPAPEDPRWQVRLPVVSPLTRRSVVQVLRDPGPTEVPQGRTLNPSTLIRGSSPRASLTSTSTVINRRSPGMSDT